MQSLILIPRRGWSGRIASLPLFWVSFFLHSFFFCFLRLAYKSRRRMNRLLYMLCAKDVLLGVRILRFHTFAYLSPKNRQN